MKKLFSILLITCYIQLSALPYNAAFDRNSNKIYAIKCNLYSLEVLNKKLNIINNSLDPEIKKKAMDFLPQLNKRIMLFNKTIEFDIQTFKSFTGSFPELPGEAFKKAIIDHKFKRDDFKFKFNHFKSFVDHRPLFDLNYVQTAFVSFKED